MSQPLRVLGNPILHVIAIGAFVAWLSFQRGPEESLEDMEAYARMPITDETVATRTWHASAHFQRVGLPTDLRIGR